MAGRYAVYYAPDPGSGFWRLGSAFIGRDAATSKEAGQPQIDGLSMRTLHEVTSSPRHYGFHATLKPPFQLHEGASPDDLAQAVADFAVVRRPFQISLMVADISTFVALVPSRGQAELSELAADCVREFDRFREPASPKERQARAKPSMSPRQLEYLERWDYPYVFEEFRFHMTLTGRIPDDRLRERLREAAAIFMSPVTGNGVRIDGVAVFHQPDRETPFCMVRRFPFAG